jgi:hypothetical protein
VNGWRWFSKNRLSMIAKGMFFRFSGIGAKEFAAYVA